MSGIFSERRDRVSFSQYDQRTIFLALELLRDTWKGEYTITCADPECSEPATHIYAAFRRGAHRLEDGSFRPIILKNSSWCAGHLGPEARRMKLEIVDDLERVYAIIAPFDANTVDDDASMAAWMQHCADVEAAAADLRAEQMARDGRALLRWGVGGAIYERSDGRIVHSFNAGPPTEVVCCIRYGAWLVDGSGQQRGDTRTPHDDDCAAATL
jgi:hypothetical protein